LPSQQARSFTGYSIAHDWKTEYGPLPVGHRLIPRIPFTGGGEFSVENILLAEAAAAMRYRAGFATGIAELPDGTQMRFEPAAADALRCTGWPSGDAARCRCLDL
jgi:hypothetical protein